MSDQVGGIHTRTNPRGTGWANVANGNVLSRHVDKASAVTQGRIYARRYATDFTIHRADGSIALTRSYASQPLPEAAQL